MVFPQIYESGQNGFPKWFSPGNKSGHSLNGRQPKHAKQQKAAAPLHTPRGHTMDRWEAGAMDRMGSPNIL